MELYKFDQASGKRITKFDSNFVMTRIAQTERAAQISCMFLEQNGLIGYHQATVPQLLFIVTGEGFVRNESEGYKKVRQGDAVFWGKDEWHETKTDTGLMAIVIESETLNPSSFGFKK
jgi:quercetin dioxygenase-like cupin family protein